MAQVHLYVEWKTRTEVWNDTLYMIWMNIVEYVKVL